MINDELFLTFLENKKKGKNDNFVYQPIKFIVTEPYLCVSKYFQNMQVIEDDIEDHFRFLVETYGFEKIPEYGFAREIFNDYRKNNVLVKFIYDGTLRVNILKRNHYEKNNQFSENNHKNIIHLQYKMSADKLNDIYSKSGNFNQQAELIADIFKDNSKILVGNFWKLTRCYRFMLYFRFLPDSNRH